jgi:hypothetical protein
MTYHVESAKYPGGKLWLGGAFKVVEVSFQPCASPAAAQAIEAGRAKSQACAARHGVDGNSAVGLFPILRVAAKYSCFVFSQNAWVCPVTN